MIGEIESDDKEARPFGKISKNGKLLISSKQESFKIYIRYQILIMNKKSHEIEMKEEKMK